MVAVGAMFTPTGGKRRRFEEVGGCEESIGDVFIVAER
jgi:hypothetical protein